MAELWRPVPEGGRIAIIAPCSPLRGMDLGPFLDWFHRRGFRTQVGAIENRRWRFLAGSDEERAAELSEALLNPEISAVWCARGGYGAGRLLRHLDLPALAATRKLFVGFSDVTMYHLGLNQAGLATVHGPMGSYLGKFQEPWGDESVERILRADLSAVETAPAGETVVPGVGEGITTGGCLTLLADSIGTPWAFSGRDKIVLLEDVDEPPYRIDARLTQLIESGSLEGAKGIVVGEMTGTNEKNEHEGEYTTWEEIVRERLEGLGIPMIMRYPFGHIREQVCIPLGVVGKLDADAGRLTFG